MAPRKPQEPEITRVRIFAETSVPFMGPLLVQLAKLGLENIGYEFIADVRTFNKRLGEQKEVKAIDFAAEWIKEHATFKAIELVRHFKADNRPPSSAYSVLRDLVSTGVLNKLALGNYQRADVKAIAAPADSYKRHDVSNRDLIWRHIKNRKKFTSNDIAVLFRAHKRPESSGTSVIAKMCHEKILKRIGEGAYAVLKKATKKAAKLKPAKPKPAKPKGGNSHVDHSAGVAEVFNNG